MLDDATLPILYSFRRCPYAMRARMGLVGAGKTVELREVTLRNKPDEMIAASPKATVPVMVQNKTVVDESFDIMLWALERNDPYDWLSPEVGTKQEMIDLIQRIDGDFKSHLDAYKYAPKPSRKDPNIDCTEAHQHRDKALKLLNELEDRLARHRYLFGSKLSLADVAIAPFVRQYANTDADWFEQTAPANLRRWLAEFVTSDLFNSVMEKHEPWQSGTTGVAFPPTVSN